MQHVEEFVYHRSGLGLGLAALGWTEGANAAIEHCSPTAREHWLDPLVAGEITAAFANTEISVGTDVLAMETHAAPGRLRLGAERPQGVDHQRPLRRRPAGHRRHRARRRAPGR